MRKTSLFIDSKTRFTLREPILARRFRLVSASWYHTFANIFYNSATDNNNQLQTELGTFTVLTAGTNYSSVATFVTDLNASLNTHFSTVGTTYVTYDSASGTLALNTGVHSFIGTNSTFFSVLNLDRSRSYQNVQSGVLNLSSPNYIAWNIPELNVSHRIVTENNAYRHAFYSTPNTVTFLSNQNMFVSGALTEWIDLQHASRVLTQLNVECYDPTSNRQLFPTKFMLHLEVE
jgi:hypothetical protein